MSDQDPYHDEFAGQVVYADLWRGCHNVGVCVELESRMQDDILLDDYLSAKRSDYK